MKLMSNQKQQDGSLNINFHAALSPSRLSSSKNAHRLISERDAETERKGKIPSQLSSARMTPKKETGNLLVKVNSKATPSEKLSASL